MIFPKEFIEQVKNNTDMVDLAGEYMHLYEMGTGVWGGNCPHPNHNDSTPSFRVIEESNSWFCGGCHSGRKGDDNYGSDSIAFIMWIEDCSFYMAIKKLAERIGLDLPSDANEELYRKQKRLAEAYHKGVSSIKGYLYARGLNDEDISKWKLGYNGKLNFPLIDVYNRIIGFTNRDLNGGHPKYKNSSNSEIFNKSYFLYGIQYMDKGFDEIRLTEGPLDVILANKYGARNVLATLGTSFTESHVKVIESLKKVPVFCFDGDQAGFKSTKKAMDLLASNGIYSKLLILPDGKDLADLSVELKGDIEEYIELNSITYGQYNVQAVINKYEAKMNELTLKLYPEIKEALSSVKHYEEREVLKGRIQKLTGVAF